MKTRFTELMGIEYPIVQGGMQHLGVPEFASVVCNAGGIGTINITIYPVLEDFHQAIKQMKLLTDKPFIVNISLVPDLTRGDMIHRYIEICAKEGVAAIETAGADPSAFIPAIKAAGIKLIHKTPSAKIAVSMEKKGADALTIAGYEVAGHPSADGVGTMVIANKVAAQCTVPVLAAGGIADGKGLAAALALGCEGVVMGTRFVATDECPIHLNHKKWILEHGERDTALTQKTIHNMARVANNMAAKLTLEMEARGTTLEELMNVIAGRLSKQAYQTGNVDGGIFAVGPAMGLIHEIKPVKRLLEDMVAEAETVSKKVSEMF